MPDVTDSKVEKMNHPQQCFPQPGAGKRTSFVDVGVMPGLSVGHPVLGQPFPVYTNQPTAHYSQRTSMDEAAMQLQAMQLDAMRKQMESLGQPVPMYTNQPAAHYSQRTSMDEAVMQTQAMQLDAMRKQMESLQNKMMNMMSQMVDAHVKQYTNQVGVFENAQPAVSAPDKSEMPQSDSEVFKAAETEIAELEGVLTDSKSSEETNHCLPADDSMQTPISPKSFRVSSIDD